MKGKQFVRRRAAPSCRSVLFGLALLTTGLVPVRAQTAIQSAAELEQQLDRVPDRPLTRAYIPRANPDAGTRVCDAALSDQLVASTQRRGEELTRTLYVEAVPSVEMDIAFARGEATLLPAGMAQLDQLATVLGNPKYAAWRFVVAGHTDHDGSADYNDRLSCERALSVRNYLSGNRGVDPARLIPMGFGYQKLKDPNNPRGEVNRRVEVRRYTASGS